MSKKTWDRAMEAGMTFRNETLAGVSGHSLPPFIDALTAHIRDELRRDVEHYAAPRTRYTTEMGTTPVKAGWPVENETSAAADWSDPEPFTVDHAEAWLRNNSGSTAHMAARLVELVTAERATSVDRGRGRR